MDDVVDQSRLPTASAAKLVKLRESCDGCLVAKVKCSKDKPLCKRCLTNGFSCVYSPSMKTGRKSQKNNPNKTTKYPQEPTNIPPRINSPLQSRSLFEAVTNADLLNSTQASFQNQDASQFSAHGHLHDVTNDLMMDGGANEPTNKTYSQMMDRALSSADYLDPFMAFFDPSKGFDFSSVPISPSTSPEHPSLDSLPTHQASGLGPYARVDISPSTHSSSPRRRARTPLTSSSSEHSPNQHQNQSCDCFTTCVQIFQTLHRHSCLLSTSQQDGGTSFDVVLNTNKKAIESCMILVSCARCVSECSKSVVMMMLATIVGKVISLYREACSLMFGSSNSMQSTAQLAFGSYEFTGENRQLLEIEILLLDLKRVAGVLMAYSEKFCVGTPAKDDELSMYESLKSHLEENLHNVVQYLTTQKDSVSK